MTLDERTERMKELCEKLTERGIKLAISPLWQHYEEVADVERFIAEASTYIPLVIEERTRLHKLIGAIDQALRVGAAEYVPSIRDVFDLIDAAIQKEPSVNQPMRGKKPTDVTGNL